MDIDNFPYPIKPDTFDEQFKFPEDVTVLSTNAIGALRSKIGSYRGYVLALWARLEYSRIALKREYDIKLAEAAKNFDDARTQKAAKEAAMLIPEVREVGDKLQKKESSAAFYEMLEKTYDVYLDILSRELTRRSVLGERE